MADREPSLKDPWRSMNPLGRATAYVWMATCVWMVLGVILDDKTLRVVFHPEPSMFQFWIFAFVVALEIPLAIMGWRRVRKSARDPFARRMMIVIGMGMALMIFGEGLFNLTRINEWRPFVQGMVLSFLFLVHFGFGYKPLATPPSEAPESKSPSPSGA